MKRMLQALRYSVRGRLALLVMAVTVPAGLLVGALVWQSYRNERESVTKHLLATTRALAALVDHHIGQCEALLDGLSASHDLLVEDFEAFHARARALVGGPDRWVVLADETGQQLVNTRVAYGSALPKQAVNAEFMAATLADRTYVSNLSIGATTREPVVFVAVPIRMNERLRYTLSYSMRPVAVAGALNVAKYSPDMTVTVVDREGTIVARHPNGEKFAGQKAMPDIVDATTHRSEGVQKSVTLEGVDVLAAHTRAPKSGWSVAIGAPQGPLYASARQLLWIGLAASGLIMTIALLLALWIGRAVVRSVDALVASTETIGQGAIPAEGSSGLAETDFVADAMLKTARQLHQRERENANLTSALQRELEKQKRTEEASRRLAAIVESSADAVISKDLDGIITSWNRGAEQIFGYNASEMVGRSITVLIPPERESEEPAILSRIRRGESIQHYETIRRRKDGRLLPISVSVSPLHDSEGRITGASKIARDITQRRRLEKQQQALYELVTTVNSAVALPEICHAALAATCRCQDADRAAILLADADGAMRFQAAIGLSENYRRRVQGHSPWAPGDANPSPIWIDDVATSSLAIELRRAVESEGIRSLAFVPVVMEKRLLGKFMIYYNAAHAFSAEELRPVEAIASQVAFAIERQRGAEALEALVHERTTSLRQVVSQMEEFSYSVSHDLRAPVRAMRGYAEAILEDHAQNLNEEGRDLLRRILRNSARMDRLIQDLLTYSRISRRELKLEAVSLEKLVHEVIQQYPDLRPERADIEIDGPLPEVLAHEPSLTQVVSNLLTNAVKFVAPSERPRVRIGFDREGLRARLWVQDNGIGIHPAHHARLFGMFERLHPDKLYEGTGIGLAIVRKAVERMNGSVGVESDGISGSRFWFELPLANGSRPAESAGNRPG